MSPFSSHVSWGHDGAARSVAPTNQRPACRGTAPLSRIVIDPSLLFGVIATQMNFISHHGLSAALSDWAGDRSRTLGQVLIDRRALTAANAEVVERLVRQYQDLLRDSSVRPEVGGETLPAEAPKLKIPPPKPPPVALLPLIDVVLILVDEVLIVNVPWQLKIAPPKPPPPLYRPRLLPPPKPPAPPPPRPPSPPWDVLPMTRLGGADLCLLGGGRAAALPALTAVIASRSDSRPELVVSTSVLTVRVAGARRHSRTSTAGRERRGDANAGSVA